MEIKQLQLFLAVADAGTLSKAAITLSITQPVITRQVRALEEELGVELFYRNGRGVVLTEAGKLLRQHAIEVSGAIGRARAEMAAMQANPGGKLVIGVPPSVGTVLTVPLVQKIRAEFPNVALRVIEGFSGHVLEWLANGRIDVAVLYNAPRHTGLTTEPLVEDELFLLGPLDDPAGVGDRPLPARRLAELPMILPSRPHGLRLLVDTVMSAKGLVARVELELEAMPSALLLVEGGLGYTILPYASVHQMVEGGRIRCWSIVEPVITRTLLLATSTQRPMTMTMRMLIRLVRAEMRDLAATGPWRPPAG
jgi:LysR family nitrogen assimilation transcriptional regulator